MNEKIRRVLMQAINVVASRGGDVETEDGGFATVDENALIDLEGAIVDAFDLPSDDVTFSDVNKINAIINDPQYRKSEASTQKFECGDIVNYHAIIGGPVTSTGHKVTFIVQKERIVREQSTAWITNKSGCVALEALSHTDKEGER